MKAVQRPRFVAVCSAASFFISAPDGAAGTGLFSFRLFSRYTTASLPSFPDAK
nr:hypothetical protein [Escherichia coli]